jgi:hypothetical protein
MGLASKECLVEEIYIQYDDNSGANDSQDIGQPVVGQNAH